MNIFRRKRNEKEEEETNSSNQTKVNSPNRQQQNSARARHSVAVSSLGTQTINKRNIFGHHQPNRPSSNQYRELPPRSISASYVPQPSSKSNRSNGIPRSTITYGKSLSQVAASPEKPKSKIQTIAHQLESKLDISTLWEWPKDQWNEFWDSLDFDEMGVSFGLGLVGLQILIRLVSGIENARRNLIISRRMNGIHSIGDRLNEARELVKKQYPTGWLEVLTFLSVCLCGYSCYNAYKLFSARRSYRMHIRELITENSMIEQKDPVNSPNVTLVQSPTAPTPQAISWAQTIWRMLRRLSSLLIGWPRSGLEDLPQPSQIHQLDVWEPSKLRLRILTFYPPPLAFLLHFATISENCMNWTIMILTIQFQTHLLIKSFTQLNKDKQIIQAEVMHEYNAQFVYPRTFPLTRSIGTMTSSAEFIRREDWVTY
ncbi:uncharacterized protein MELLADRAFT_116799 [Melampsora larici-populina 98AG31]|uniref:Uncharacterized protein n=1 Tax=Melampsora larici-populina (strain 98AG31 / pathotype 3-4-7) TaxID=747676 RepID=F4RQK6_MELLP|nr:uncharacterized protein MELLADRAFT_116799 [Melampsora larici-populina 98AG31]EGG05316.1 hypothetical protein MELLADRAFT_116799 [Melampsora larici-populina 98AG31]